MSVTIEPTVELDFVPPRVRLDITVDAGEASVTVTRQDPDGRIVPVRTATGDPLEINGTEALLYDYEAPLEQQVWYSTLEDPTSAADATVDESRIWLIHPGVPVLSRPITVKEWGGRSRPVAQGVYLPMGRKTAVVHTDGQRKSAQYGLTLLTLTADEAADLEALLEDTSPLLLNVPPSKAAGVTYEYVSVADLSADRLVRLTSNPIRVWPLSCTVVARPAGGSQATRTYTDLMIDYATYADVYAAYSTYLDLLAGP